MKETQENHPPCFGEMDKVFPEGDDGLRHTPEKCFECGLKTECLKTAMKASGGLKVREECVDRAYESGMIGFLERWSKKKTISQRKRQRRIKS